jgi:hypothetical protein
MVQVLVVIQLVHSSGCANADNLVALLSGYKNTDQSMI